MTKPIRRAYPSDLTDKEWAIIKRFLPEPAKTGRPMVDNREVINGILYVLSTGCRWRDLPHDIKASSSTCYRRLRQYLEDNIWHDMFASIKKLADKQRLLNWRNSYLDASIVKSKKGAKNM